MSEPSVSATTIDEYIAAFPIDVQERLQAVRAAIRKAAPAAQEAISYRIPTFKLNGSYLIYFAAFKAHIGVYPIAPGTPGLEHELARYGSGKATLRFGFDTPLPLDVIERVVRVKIEHSARRAGAKRTAASRK